MSSKFNLSFESNYCKSKFKSKCVLEVIFLILIVYNEKILNFKGYFCKGRPLLIKSPKVQSDNQQLTVKYLNMNVKEH